MAAVGLEKRVSRWSKTRHKCKRKKVASIAAVERQPATKSWDHSFPGLAEIARVASVLLPRAAYRVLQFTNSARSATIMIRALFVALLLVCCSVCSATGAISLPVYTHLQCTRAARTARASHNQCRHARGVRAARRTRRAQALALVCMVWAVARPRRARLR